MVLVLVLRHSIEIGSWYLILSCNLQDSVGECSSPAVCIKDSLYPLRKELLNKSFTPWSAKNKARKALKNGTPVSTQNIRTRSSKETVINSPWIKNETTSSVSSVIDAGGMKGNEEASGSGETGSEKTDDNHEVTARQSCVRTRAQKRKLSFKENREMEVSLFHVLFCCNKCQLQWIKKDDCSHFLEL